jgi:thioredoxin-related protein
MVFISIYRIEDNVTQMNQIIRTVLLIAMMCFSPNAIAAELLMLEQNGCAWCKRWHEEIGHIYPNTDEAKIAPLRVVNIHEPWPEDLKNIQIERFTPTFVLVEDGIEIGRMRGYTGDNFFWFLLKEMLDKLPEEKSG